MEQVCFSSKHTHGCVLQVKIEMTLTAVVCSLFRPFASSEFFVDLL